MKCRDLIRLLESRGFKMIRSSKHMIFSNGVKTVAVPHQKEIRSWTVHQIKKQGGLI